MQMLSCAGPRTCVKQLRIKQPCVEQLRVKPPCVKLQYVKKAAMCQTSMYQTDQIQEQQQIMNDRAAGEFTGSPVSLYLHLPFCVRKCRYCDFLSGPYDAAVRRRYLRALETEIRLSAETFGNGSLSADTVFLGGGTPSLLDADELAHLMAVLSESFRILPGAEITMECNPGTVGREKLLAFREAGINRLSIGVQSFRDEELKLLGRIHTAEEARQCILDARWAGFDNISLDLISALPGQNIGQWMESLREAVALAPEHISAYSLILEDGTPLKEAALEGKLPRLPDEDEDRKMYHETRSFLAEHGYHRYEISNYAKKGFESRHNSGYWTGHPYLGFGIGAASFYAGCRWSHTRSMTSYLQALESAGALAKSDGESLSSAEKATGHRCQEYAEVLESIYEEKEILSEKDRMAEFMFLGLRRMQGVSEAEFLRRFGRTMEEVYGPVLKRYQELHMLQREGGRIFLTERGIDVSNAVMADFLPDE